MHISEIPLSRYMSFAVFALLAVASLSEIRDYDIWYHLSIGREIVGSFSIPATEFLVYPNAGKPAVFHEWGFGVLMYLVYSAGGINGLAIANALIMATTIWLLSRAGKSDNLDVLGKLFAVAIVFLNIDHSRYFRPELILFIALAAEIYLLERFLSKQDKASLTPIPLIAFILSQAHPSVIFLVYVLGCYGLYDCWVNRKNRGLVMQHLSWLGVTGAAIIALASINPYGISQVIEPLSFASQNKVLGFVQEFKPALESANRDNFLLLASFSVLVLLTDRSRFVLNVLLILAFGFLAFRYQRNISLLAIVIFVPMAKSFAILLRGLLQKTAGFLGKKGTSRIESAVTVLAIAVLLTAIGLRANNAFWGVGVAEEHIPVGPAAVINEVRPQGRIFNFYEFGGYLAWAVEENNQVFIDGRNNRMSRSLAAHNSIVWRNAGWQRAFEQYGVSTVVVPTVISYTGTLLPITETMLNSPEWALAYASYRQLVFFKRSDVPLAEEFDLNRVVAWKQLEFDARVSMSLHPDEPNSYLSYGKAQANLGDRETAILAYRKYLAMKPEDLDARKTLAELESAQ